jgi:hypothetical protein
MTATRKYNYISKREQAKLDLDYAKEHLLTHYLKEGDKVYTILRSVSSSGMTRHISLVIGQGSEMIDITYYVAHAMGEKVSEIKGHRTIKVSGCGMDMGFHLVYNLSSVLFAGQERAGYVLKQGWI